MEFWHKLVVVQEINPITKEVTEKGKHLIPSFIVVSSSTKGTRCGQDQCSCALRKLSQVGWPTSTTHTIAN
jgi:hypothetical protein